MSYFEAYLIFQVMDKMAGIVGFMSFISTISFLVFAVFTAFYWNEEIKGYELDEYSSYMRTFRFLKNGVKVTFMATIVFGMMTICIPDTNTMLKIIGAKYVTNNQDIKEITDSLPKLIKEKIADELKQNQK